MKQYIVDAFTNRLFGGNPAAICLLDNWLSDELMLKITIENNLSETAFIVPVGNQYHLRWFTPGGEIDLCGHATLASAFVIMNYLTPTANKVIFKTLSGLLTVQRNGDLYEMSFPTYSLTSIDISSSIIEALGKCPKEVYLGRDLLCIFEDEKTVIELQPDIEKLKQLEGLLVHVSASGKKTDCVSRSFAPKLNVIEDPVCGSGHCHIVPYWSQKLHKLDIIAYQASKRGGTLYTHMIDDGLILSGYARLYAIAELYIEGEE